MKILTEEIRKFRRTVLLPLQLAASQGQSGSEKECAVVVAAASALCALARGFCFAVEDVPTEVLRKVSSIRKGLPAVVTQSPLQMAQVRKRLRELKVGNPRSRLDLDHTAVSTAAATLRYMARLRSRKKNVGTGGSRPWLATPCDREILALPPLSLQSAAAWWRVMKKLYRHHGLAPKGPLGAIWRLEDSKLRALVTSPNSRSLTSSKPAEIRSKLLEKLRKALMDIARDPGSFSVSIGGVDCSS